LYKGAEGVVSIRIDPQQETVWASQAQIVGLFGITQSVVSKHIRNVFADGEVDRGSNMQKMHITGAFKPTMLYSLDVILAVGYRANSAQAIHFRQWATTVLRQHILKGYSLNQKRLAELNTVIEVIGRSDTPEIAGIADVLRDYAVGLGTLDDYDHQRVSKTNPKAKAKAWRLSYEEARAFIDTMKFGRESALFGHEKDESFKASLGAIYQTFGRRDVYPSVQEKAANLLYLVVKNHSFSDGNKRIAAALFVYFLDKNKALRDKSGRFIIANNALAAMTLMLALSKPQEKDIMCALVMKMLEAKND
jgi:prophage maintenance system killer protein